MFHFMKPTSKSQAKHLNASVFFFYHKAEDDLIGAINFRKLMIDNLRRMLQRHRAKPLQN